MQVVYLGTRSQRANLPPQVGGNAIELLWDSWDDYGFKTSFPITCRLNGKIVELPRIQLLVDGEYTSSVALNRILKDGWDGVFPVPDVNYLSVPGEITFYEQIEGALGIEAAIDVAKALRDASYLVHVADDANAKALVSSHGFRASLQREHGSRQAFMDGWKVLEQNAITVLDLGFRFKTVRGNATTLKLKFETRIGLPHDVNVLVGPNGCGKSQLLLQMVKDWISPSDEDEHGFVKRPNLSQIVVVSYSPFERFPVDLAGQELQDNDSYRYFGLRGRSIAGDASGHDQTTLSHHYPKRNVARSLVRCLADDRRLGSIRGWPGKVATMERVLRTAIKFDFAAVEFQRGATEFGPLAIEVYEGKKRRCFIPITSNFVDRLDDERLGAALEPASGVTFFLDGKPRELSSGQHFFSCIVTNILGAIRRNSLILVDEPELSLHPTLEIQFVDMLKTILSRFNSKALLATHSVVTVREIPSDCVHVFDEAEGDVILKRPPFQTLGGDFQRISSYVFGDKDVSKPFERWIRERLEELGSAKALIKELDNDINEELIVQIKATERGQW